MVMLNIKQVYELINIAIASTKIHSIRTPSYSIRPNIHVILCGSIGSRKSSILKEVCEKMHTHYVFGLTNATLLGTVDKQTGQANLPAIWDARNNILAIDELHVGIDGASRNLMPTFLSVLEHPEYTRKIGYRCNNIDEHDKDLYCIIKDGSIKVKTRFTLIANTMHKLWKEQRMIELEALKNRCLVLPYYPDVDELIAIIEGKIKYSFKNYAVKQNVKITKKQTDEILCMIKKANVDENKFLRTFGDMCRVIAVTNDKEILKIVLSLKG